MRDRRINKEWLSLHQCIDEHCPVHSVFCINPVTGDSSLPKTEPSNSNINSEYMHDSFTTNKLNQHKRNVKPIAELGDKQNDQNEEDNNGVSVDLSYRPGALKTISQCYEDRTITYSPSDSLKTLMQEYRDEAEETLNTTEGIDDRVSKRVSEIGRPRFLCTWLDKHADINNYPFYKLAVYYGSQNRVRKDAAVYSSFVTSQIWTSHKYIGSLEDVANTGENTINARVAGSKSSRSHENLSQNVDSILKDIAHIDISDLKLKYGFLFNPNFIFKRIDKNNAENKIRNENFGTQKLCQNLNHSVRIGNSDCIGRSSNGDNFVHPRDESYSKAYVNQYFNGGFAKENDGIQPSSEKQPTLNGKYNCSELNSVMFKTDQGDGCVNSGSRSASNVGANVGCSPNLSRHRPSPARKFNMDSTNTRRDQFTNKENITTVFCDNLGRCTDPNTKTSVPSTNSAAYCSETTASPYLKDYDLGNCYIMENSLHQTPNVPSPFSSHYTGSPYHASALTVSPLVSSPAFTHYVSPAGHLNTPMSTDHSLHYYTKRNKDPRLQASDNKKTSDCPRRDERSEVQRLVSTPDLLSFSDSSIYSPCDEIHSTYHDRHSRHRFNTRAHERPRMRSKERRQQCKFYNEDEDPLNGLDLVNTVGQQSPERNIESPNSDIFYRINENQNREEHNVDDVMDLFYAEKCCHEKDAASNSYSPFVKKHRSRSPWRSRYREIRSRSPRYLRDMVSRGWSRSKETALPASRQYRSHRFRCSKSSSTELNRRRDSKYSRHSGSLGKNRTNLHCRESSISRSDRKRYSNSNSNKRKAENKHLSYKDLQYARRHERRIQDYSKEKRRASKSPDSRLLGRTKSHKREKTRVSSFSPVRSPKSERSKTIESCRCHYRTTTKSSHKRDYESRRLMRCARRQ